MARRLAIAAVLATAGCAPSAPAERRLNPSPSAATSAAVGTAPPTTTPAATPSTTVPSLPATAIPPASRAQAAAAPSPPVPPTAEAGGVAGQGDDFWRELANCECASGHCGGGHIGWFQFSPDTAAKVGIDGTEGYEEQRAAAQEWARRIHPREATKAGWPHCWGVALAKAAA